MCAQNFCIDLHTSVCKGVCIGVGMDLCMGACVDVCTDKCMDVCTGVCACVCTLLTAIQPFRPGLCCSTQWYHIVQQGLLAPLTLSCLQEHLQRPEHNFQSECAGCESPASDQSNTWDSVCRGWGQQETGAVRWVTCC